MSSNGNKIPKDSDLKKAALLGCCLSTGIGTILNQSKPKKNGYWLWRHWFKYFNRIEYSKNKNIDCFDVKLKNLDKAKILGAKVVI